MKTITAVLSLVLTAGLLGAAPPQAKEKKPGQAAKTVSAKASVSAKVAAKKPCPKAAAAGSKAPKPCPKTTAKKPCPKSAAVKKSSPGCSKASAKAPAFLGVKMAPHGSSKLPGVYVAGVFPGSSAAKAGLKGGDVIQKLNDQSLRNPGQLVALVRTKKPGDVVTLTVANARSDKLRQVKAKLGGAPRDLLAAAPSRNSGEAGKGDASSGIPRVSRNLRIFREGKAGQAKPGESGIEFRILTPEGVKAGKSLKDLEDLGISINVEKLLEGAKASGVRSAPPQTREVEELRKQVRRLTEEVQRLRRRLDEK